MLALDDQKCVQILALAYRDFSKMIADNMNGLNPRSKDEIKRITKMMEMMENTVSFLDQMERTIIYHEVILGQKGKWYMEYFSPSVYRRKRKIAYHEYVRLLHL